jgi:hypothetical protein
MSRTTYVKDEHTGKIVPIQELSQEGRRLRALKHRRPVRGVITDTMDALKHPGTGLWYDSKKAFDKASRDTGYSNDWSPPKDGYEATNGVTRPAESPDIQAAIEADVEQAVERAANDLKWGNQYLSPEQKTYAKDVNEKLEAAKGLPNVSTEGSED